MSTANTDSTILTYQNNQPTFTNVRTNSILTAQDGSVSGLSLPASTDTTKQYVVKVNADGNYYFDNFTVTTDMEVTQAPNQWNLYGAENTKMTGTGVIISMDNGASAYTIDLTSTGFCGLRYNNTQKKIIAQTIYQGPKDMLDANGQRLAANGLMLSINNGARAKILPVTGNNVYGLMLNNTTSEPELTQINNHSHSAYELYVCKYQTTSDTTEDNCYVQTSSKPYYIINSDGLNTTRPVEIDAGTYLVNIDLELECLDMSLLQRDPYTFSIGVGSIPTNTLTTDNKVANRLNIHYSLIYTHVFSGALTFTIGRANIEKAYRWNKIHLTVVKINN